MKGFLGLFLLKEYNVDRVFGTNLERVVGEESVFFKKRYEVCVRNVFSFINEGGVRGVVTLFFPE